MVKNPIPPPPPPTMSKISTSWKKMGQNLQQESIITKLVFHELRNRTPYSSENGQ